MSRIFTTTTTLAVALGCTAAQADDKSTKTLDGTYTLKSMTKNGKPVADEILASVESVTLSAGKLTMTMGKNNAVSVIDVDAGKSPMQLEFKPSAEDKTALPGVAGISGNDLTLLFSEDGKRPAKLDATGDKLTCLVLTKKK